MAQDQAEAPFYYHCQPLCQACAGETRTMYVWLTSGKTVKLGNVRSVQVTPDTVIFECAAEQGEHAVEFRRKDVYYAACSPMALPPAS